MQETWINECMSLFPNARDFTAEETKAYTEGLERVFQPTGRNIFKDKNTENQVTPWVPRDWGYDR